MPGALEDEGGTSDPGLAGERTSLALNRSGLALAVCVAAALRRIWPLDRPGSILAVALIAGGAGLWSLALVGGRLSGPRPDGPMPARSLRRISIGTLLLAGGACVVSLLPPP